MAALMILHFKNHEVCIFMAAHSNFARRVGKATDPAARNTEKLRDI
jgi:hypothetical protein